MAYEPELWHELFVMIGGAAAALAGLLFVAVSLNHEQILQLQHLPSLAARSLIWLLSLVALAAFVLTPQSTFALGIEIAALGAVATIAGLSSALVTARAPAMQRSWKANVLVVAVVASLPLLVSGISLIIGAGGGLYWALAGCLTAIAAAMNSAWTLLIEIRR